MLGFIYPFEKENACQPQALICTNSDRLEHCEELVKALPQMHFHIAALTEMSPKLMGVGSFNNVSLYPGVKISILDQLFEQCSYYFDINHESEIVSAVRRAFLHNHLIFAFRETMHNGDYVEKEQIFPASEWERMAAGAAAALADEEVRKRLLLEQKKTALAETAEAYQSLGSV